MLLACCLRFIQSRYLILLALLPVLLGCSDQPSVLQHNNRDQAILFFATTNLTADGQHIRFHRDIITAADENYWQFDLYDLPLYRHSGIRLQHALDIATETKLTLTPQQQLILHSPAIRPPLMLQINAQWLMIRPVKQSASDSIWYTPAFTPDIAESAQQETLRRARLAESMADDAYFFGYSTNDDALE